MSRRSAKRPGKEGAVKAPSTRERLFNIEKLLAEMASITPSAYRLIDGPLLDHTEGVKAPGGLTGNNKLVGLAPKTPTIKPRLEDIIGRLQRLNMMLDGLGHTMYGDGNPTTGDAPTPSPFTVPDMLEVIETQISRLDDRLNGIVARF